MHDTPRTNAAAYNGYKYLVDEARKMEREIAAYRAEVHRLATEKVGLLDALKRSAVPNEKGEQRPTPAP